ncbi:MAG: hypothetical protein KY460_06145 [Actinobacteria bacterium]|nr:hypothetical protein [Actinomycetota bacterium]
MWHDGNPFARPAVIVVDTDGNEVIRQVGGEFSDRMHEPELVEQLRNLDDVVADDATRPREGPVDTEQPEPGDDALPVDALLPNFKGTRFAAIALAAREPDAKHQADRLKQQAEGHLEALQALDAGT